MKLSIITINYNNLIGLRKTMESVFAQTYCDFEYIIVDGASTDGSKEYLDTIQADYNTRSLTNKLPNLQIVSESDTGIYNAMNKGIRLAHGEYLLFLNSGDYFYNGFIAENFCKNNQIADIYAGKVVEEGTHRKIAYLRKKVTLWGLFYSSVPHQGTFIKRSLFQQIGMYSEDLKVLSDYEFLLKAILNDVPFELCDIIISYVEPGGISSTQIEKMKVEQQIIFERVLPLCVKESFVQIQQEMVYNREAVIWLQKSKWLYNLYCQYTRIFHIVKCMWKKVMLWV